MTARRSPAGDQATERMPPLAGVLTSNMAVSPVAMATVLTLAMNCVVFA